jgi:hypothetical protein
MRLAVQASHISAKTGEGVLVQETQQPCCVKGMSIAHRVGTGRIVCNTYEMEKLENGDAV